MDFQLTIDNGNTESEAEAVSVAEVSLESVGHKPASTDELKMMLKEAGTELTVKYITGEIGIEEFCLELEKRRPKQKNPPAQQAGTSSIPAYLRTPNIPQFDKLMEENDNDEDSDDFMDDDGEELDAGEILDSKDTEWQPDSQQMKKLKKGQEKGEKTKDLPTRKKLRKIRRRLSDLPKVLASLHGKAMLLRAQGKIEESMMLLFDLIEKAPLAYLPFKTMGNIHEEKGDLEQALKFYMVAANLRRSDVHEWFNISNMWIDLKNEKMALMCIFKAFRYARTHTDKLEALSQRVMFYERFDHPQKTILFTKDLMISYMHQSDPTQVLEFARGIVKEFIELQEVSGAISCLLNYFKELPDHIDSEDVHLLVELLISQKNYKKCLEIMIKLCAVECDTETEKLTASNVESLLTDSSTRSFVISRLTVPFVMPIDLKCKLIQILLLGKFIKSLDVIDDLLKEVGSINVEEYGDIHYDVAETLIQCGFQEPARCLLESLVKSKSFSKAAVWLSYGQCLNSLGLIQEAARAYETVLEMAPGNYEARVTLSSLQQQMGHHDKALELLSKDPTKETGTSTDQLLLLRKCQFLYSQGKIDEFAIAAKQLLSFNFKGQFRPDFIKTILNSRTIKHRIKIFPELFLQNKGKDQTDDGPNPIADQTSDLQKSELVKFKRQVWDVYLKLFAEMRKQNRLPELVETSVLAVTSPTFYFGMVQESVSMEAEFICLKICIASKANNLLGSILRAVISKAEHRNQAWNLYCYVGTMFNNIVDLRFAMRGLMKNPGSVALRMLNGTARMISGSYKQALGEYISVFRKDPKNDLSLLCCGVCMLHLTSQVFMEKKNLLLSQVLVFFNAYIQLRGECQEVYFNMGRALQQLNLQYLAIHFYQKALELPPAIEDDKGCFDLSCEIGYNLVQVYMQNGNEDYARYYLEKYCII